MSEPMPVRELIQKFRDEWVLMGVLEEDECDEPRKVRVIATSRHRDKIYEKQKEVEGDIAILYTGRIPKKGLCGGILWLNCSLIQNPKSPIITAFARNSEH